MTYDYLIVGAGFYGAICARELTDKGHRCLVLDRRSHIAGNCYTDERDGIHLHAYGPHIFHTSNERVWQYINRFARFNQFRLHPVANYRGELYSLPFNMWTFNRLWGVTTPDEARRIIAEQSADIDEPANLEEQAIKSVGRDVYEKLIKGYTEKQWMRPAASLPKEIIKRLPVRFTYDANYFNDTYQGIPVGGYTRIFTQLLAGIEVRLDTDFLADRAAWEAQARTVIYTGPIDEFFGYAHGPLEYKTTRFEHERLPVDNHQGVAMMNYTDAETPYTRVIEHKHFDDQGTPHTWVSHEYPQPYEAGKQEPYYPVNDAANNAIYARYRDLADQLPGYHFGGRLADYRYYDMHNIIEKALLFTDTVEAADAHR